MFHLINLSQAFGLETQESADFSGVYETDNLPASWFGSEIVKQTRFDNKILLEPRLTPEITQAVVESIDNLGIEILSHNSIMICSFFSINCSNL